MQCNRILFSLIILGIGGWFLLSVKEILMPFIIAIIIAYLLDPLVAYFIRLKFSRPAATIATLIVFFFIIIVFSLTIVPIIFTQSAKLIELLSEFTNRIDQQYLLDFMHKIQIASPELVNKIQESIGDFTKFVISFLINFLKQIFHSGLVAVNILSFIFITPIITYYVLRDLPSIIHNIRSLIPKKFKSDANILITNLNTTLSGYLRGQSYVCLILGSYYAFALMLCGLESGFTLGFISGILTFIPYVGAIAGSLLAVIAAGLQYHNWNYVFLVMAIFIIGQILEGNFIAPKLIGDNTGLHPVWIMFGLLAGGSLLGFFGILLAVPLTAIIGVVIRFSIKKYKSSELYN